MRIALYQGTSLVSRLIRWQTRSKYSHAAFLLDDNSVIEAWPPAVRRNQPANDDLIAALSAGHTPGTVVDIFEFLCPLSPTENSKLEYFIRQDIGKPYDYLSVLRFISRRPQSVSSRDKIFCSEQVFGRCAQIGRRLLERTEAWRVSPELISLTPHLNLTKTIITT